MIIIGPWSVSTADDRDEATKSFDDILAATPQPTPTSTPLMPNRGKRTARELALAAVPARTSWIVAGVAVGLAIFLNGVNWIYPSPRLSVYAHMFEFMPIWLLIGGSLHQVGARIGQAWDDWQAWRKS